MRRALRSGVIGLLVGVLGVAGAWAGVGLGPVPETDSGATLPPLEGEEEEKGTSTASSSSSIPPDEETEPDEVGSVIDADVTPPADPLSGGLLYVGANRTSLTPRPDLFGDGDDTWRRDPGCEIDGGDDLEPGDLEPEAVPERDGRWPGTKEDCIYLGGFGIGAHRAARDVDEGGVWVRTVAFSNGGETLVHQIIDSTGYFYRYRSEICTDCGIHDIRQDLAGELGVPEGNLVIASTHSHSAADNYGGWGGVPEWYSEQIRRSSIASAKQAVANMTSARVRVGVTNLRPFNSERRDTYYSNEDDEAVWLQARAVASERQPFASGKVVASLLNFAGHPTIVNENELYTAVWNDAEGRCEFDASNPKPVLHADWPGAAARTLEDEAGGVGLVFEGGLGNVSVSDRRPEGLCDATPGEPTGSEYRLEDRTADETGRQIARAALADVDHDGQTLTDSTIAAEATVFSHPLLTNRALITLGQAGFFDRESVPGTPGADGPGTFSWAKSSSSGERLRACTSASETQIRTVAGAHRIGEFGVAFGPGELFSNLVETVKAERDDNAALAVYSQANDALGYVIQSFEYDEAGGIALDALVGEYEETFSIDRCLGDHVTEVILDAAAEVGL